MLGVKIENAGDTVQAADGIRECRHEAIGLEKGFWSLQYVRERQTWLQQGHSTYTLQWARWMAWEWRQQGLVQWSVAGSVTEQRLIDFATEW